VTPDHFARLDEPRRPWLDTTELKAKFHALTSQHHPDVAGEDSPDFAALNVAYNTLRDPRLRLRHLLELEAPQLLSRQIPAPSSIGDLFLTMGAKTQALDKFLQKRATTKSTLGKAMLITDQLMLQEDLEKWLHALQQHQERWLKLLPELDNAWQQDKAATAPKLAETAQALSYLDKWSAQIREGLVKLQIGE
jgi:hypothetical protein